MTLSLRFIKPKQNKTKACLLLFCFLILHWIVSKADLLPINRWHTIPWDFPTFDEHTSSPFTWPWKILKWLPGLCGVRHLEHIAASKLLRWGYSGTQSQFWGLSHFWLRLLHLLTPKDMFTSDPETSAISNYKDGNGNVAFLFFSSLLLFLFSIEKGFKRPMKCKIAFFAIVAKLISLFIWDGLVANFQNRKANAITHFGDHSPMHWAQHTLHLSELEQMGEPPQWPALSSRPPFTLTISHQFILPAKFLHILTFLPKVTLTHFYSPSLNFFSFCAGKIYKYLGHYCCSSVMTHLQNTSSTGDCSGDYSFLYEIPVY